MADIPVPTVVLGQVGTPAWANAVSAAVTELQAGPWYAQAVANQTGITTVTDLTGCTVTFTAVAGRRYKVTGVALPSGSNEQCTLTLTDGANVLKQQGNVVAPPSAETVVVNWVSNVSISGTTTWKLRIERVGAAAMQNNATPTAPSFILVEDIGSL